MKKVLIISPLPPPYGGATVSAKLFLDHLQHFGCVEYDHVSWPILSEENKRKDFCNKMKSAFWFIRIFFTLKNNRMVIFFASRNSGMFYGSLLSIFGKIWRVPVFVRFFGGHPMKSQFMRYPLINNFILRALKYSRGIMVETHAGSQEFPRNFENIIHVVPGYRPPTSFKRSKKNKDQNSGLKTIKFVFVGVISKAKGTDILLESFAHLQFKLESSVQITLDLFGHGDSNLLKEYVSNASVRYHGSVQNEHLRKQLPEYDVLVFSSIYDNEGHPGVLIEGLMAGLAIIAAASTPSVYEVIQHEKNGMIIPPGNLYLLSNAMERLALNDAFREGLAERALKDSEQFGSDIVLPKMMEIFELNCGNTSS